MYHIASEEIFKDGDVIFKEGSSGDWVYVIISGGVEIYKTVKGREITIEVLQPEEVFGELSFFGEIKRTASARASGDTTLGVIDRSFMDQEFNKISSDLRTILVAVVMRFKKMLERATDFSMRREKRIIKTLSLQFKTPRAFKNAYTKNLSLGGLYIMTKNPLEKGEKFMLKLQLPGLEEPMKITCEVAWTQKETGDADGRPIGMGVKFSEMNERDEKSLKQFIKALAKHI